MPHISFTDRVLTTQAAVLILSFILTFDSDQTIKCWDPNSIYFLTDTKGNIAIDTPYALFSSKDIGTRQPADNLQYALLARLLMEIECGISLEHISVNSGCDNKPGVQTFEDFMDDQDAVDLCESRISYLRAVRQCFRFKRKYQRMAAVGHFGGESAVVRDLAYSIIKNIKHTKKRDPFPHTREHPRGYESRGFRWPKKSSELDHQLGMANHVPAQPLPEVAPLKEIKAELRIRTKRVQFMFDEPIVVEQDTIEAALVDSPVATIDDCELFGGEETQEAPPALYVPHVQDSRVVHIHHIITDARNRCKSARKWVTEFKKLRKKKTGLNSRHRIRVAVLDTGVDTTHPNIRGEVVEYKSFVDDDAAVDRTGHGTHIAGVILDLTTNVDLYVGKVIDSRKSEARGPIVEVSPFPAERSNWLLR